MATRSVKTNEQMNVVNGQDENIMPLPTLVAEAQQRYRHVSLMWHYFSFTIFVSYFIAYLLVGWSVAAESVFVWYYYYY